MNHGARLAHQLRVQSMMANGLAGRPRLGEVTSYDQDTYSAKVKLQPEGIETGFLPIMSQAVANGWGVQFGPRQGDQAVVIFQEGDSENGVVIGFLFSDEDRPQKVPAGELWLTGQGDTYIRLTQDGLRSKGDWEHEGDFKATGTITGEEDVVAGDTAISGKSHTHSGVTPGPGVSGAPVP